MGEARYRLRQDGMIVASVAGPTAEARSSILHYAAVYGRDGPVAIEVHNGRRWTMFKENA